MRTLCAVAAVVVAMISVSVRVEAQHAGPERAPAPRVQLPRHDAWGTIGWFHSKTDAPYTDDWYHRSLWAGAEAGWYWTEHLKTEVGAAATTRGTVFSGGERRVIVDGQTYYEWGHLRERTRRATVRQLYQFGHNVMVHPFLGLGLDVVGVDQRQLRYRYPASVFGAAVTLPETTSRRTLIEAAVVGGVKAYFNRTVFFRTDFAAGGRAGVVHVVARFGVGADF